uniref:Uncharacterized protein n=1 Tax=Alexandrium monilatum TaxID=311494 RepID=A0A7S4PTX9_9DINO
MASARPGTLALALASLLGAGADWLATHTADSASADKLQGQLRERFGKKIDGIHTSSVRSFYWAEKAIREEQEVRTLLDSEVPFLELRRLVESVHPYELPMIVSAAHGGPLIAKRESLEKYLMGAVDVNETTAEEAEMIAKELVQIRYVACSHVEKLEDKEDTHRVTVKTTAGSRTHIVREFGGLDFEWTPLQGNRPFLQWVEAAAVPSSAEL